MTRRRRGWRTRGGEEIWQLNLRDRLWSWLKYRGKYYLRIVCIVKWSTAVHVVVIKRILAFPRSGPGWLRLRWAPRGVSGMSVEVNFHAFADPPREEP